MKFSSYKFPSLLSISSLALLTACGGGGGGGDSDVPTQGSSAITVENAPTVARETTIAMNALEMSADESFGALSTETRAANLVNISVQHLRQVLSNKLAKSGVGPAVTENITIDCPEGGTTSIVANVANPHGSITNGDSVSFTYNNCKYGSAIYTGGYKITFTSVVGDLHAEASAWSMTTQTEFKSFSFKSPEYTSGINGGLTIKYGQSANSDFSYTVGGNSLQVSGTEDGISSSYAFSSFSMSGEGVGDLETSRSNFTVFGNIPKLGNNVAYTVKTVKDFKERFTNNHAHQGELVITATNKSTLRFTVIDATNVQIAVDTDGDGTLDNTRTMTWEEFYAG